MSLPGNDTFFCPYCGQENQLFVDISAGARQQFVVDCEVCCAPIVVRVSVRVGEIFEVDVRRENE